MNSNSNSNSNNQKDKSPFNAAQEKLAEALNNVSIDPEGMSMSSLFIEGQKIYDSLQNSTLSSMDVKYQVDVRKSYLYFHACGHSIRKNAVFSRNEEFDDINTNDLKYLLVAYYLGVLESMAVDKDERKDHLTSSCRYFTGFLGKMEEMNFMSKEDIVYFRDLESQKEVRRDVRTVMLKEKELQSKLTEILKRKEKFSGNSIINSNNNNNIGMKKSVDIDDVENDGAIDAELEREQAKLLLQICVTKAINNYNMNIREIQMIDFSKSRAGQELQRNPLPPPERKPIKAVTITADSRNQLHAKVFRPSHALPTMSLDEWYEDQVSRGILPDNVKIEAEQRESAIQARKAKKNPDYDPESQYKGNNDGDDDDKDEENEDNDEQTAEAKRKKKSSWDDWKDWNPRGAGNINRRG